MPRNGKQFHVWTIGCQMNEADARQVADALSMAGAAAIATNLIQTNAATGLAAIGAALMFTASILTVAAKVHAAGTSERFGDGSVLPM